MPPTIHVVHVIARLNVGGPAAILDVLAGHQGGSVRHTVLAGRLGRGETEWSALRGTQLTTVTVPGLTPAIQPAGDVIAVRALRRILRDLQPDIVHTHTAKGGLVGRLAARAEVIPAVHTFHGHVLNGYFSAPVTRTYLEIERRLAKRTARLLTVGERVGADLLAAGVGTPTQYRTVPPAVHPPRRQTRSAARQALGLDEDTEVLLSLGRLTGIKRVDRAVEVTRRLVAQGRPVVLLIAGGGELEGSLRSQAADLGHHIRFLGWVADVGMVLSAADLVLLTSANEGMPIGLVEAASMGVPAVATDVGSVREVVLNGQTGVVVSPTVTALAEGTMTLLDDPHARARMGALAVRHASEQFSAARLISLHEHIYHEVLA